MSKLDVAIDLIDNGEIEKGLEYLDQIKKGCTDEEKYTIAENYYRWGFVDQAKEIVELLHEFYPEEGELSLFLAEIMIDLDEEEDAIEVLATITEEDPAYVQSLLLQGDLYQMQGLSEVSERKLLLAKKKLPQEPIIDLALAELYSSQGDFKKSIEYYNIVLDEHEVVAGINVNSRIAESLSAAGEFEDALPFYEKAIKAKEEIDTLFRYGFTAFQAGYYKTTIESLIKLKEIDHEYSSLYLYLSKAYEHEGMLEESYNTIVSGLKVDEFNKELQLYAGEVSMKVGRKENVEQHLREAIALDPGYIEAVQMLTKFLLKEERYDEIIECIEQVSSYGEFDPGYDWDLATAKNKLEQYSDALNHYRQAYTSFKDDIDFLEEYGYFLVEEGKREEALIVFKRILEIDPTKVEIEETVNSFEL
ncbi:tetratricopeptide repeat protein [Cytobacillus sp. S13-E01]|uniref:tetratricopeptide repeat protein n=1 Tax=Cytobacillus sp. S13-E01 TaxID=3031326 RepID=UPI0023D82C06|nr:tetratricopeptide repeat protein [Cytobacillus sp. S13-E01]MDF0726237.1 tetratricopeptide repeat protein [Cytobacillus sp. S13-E01]